MASLLFCCTQRIPHSLTFSYLHVLCALGHILKSYFLSGPLAMRVTDEQHMLPAVSIFKFRWRNQTVENILWNLACCSISEKSAGRTWRHLMASWEHQVAGRAFCSWCLRRPLATCLLGLLWSSNQLSDVLALIQVNIFIFLRVFSLQVFSPESTERLCFWQQ